MKTKLVQKNLGGVCSPKYEGGHQSTKRLPDKLDDSSLISIMTDDFYFHTPHEFFSPGSKYLHRIQKNHDATKDFSEKVLRINTKGNTTYQPTPQLSGRGQKPPLKETPHFENTMLAPKLGFLQKVKSSDPRDFLKVSTPKEAAAE